MCVLRMCRGVRVQGLRRVTDASAHLRESAALAYTFTRPTLLHGCGNQTALSRTVNRQPLMHMDVRMPRSTWIVRERPTVN